MPALVASVADFSSSSSSCTAHGALDMDARAINNASMRACAHSGAGELLWTGAGMGGAPLIWICVCARARVCVFVCVFVCVRVCVCVTIS